MAYDTDNPPRLLVPSFTNSSNQCSIWIYSSTDTATAVDADGYISDGQDLGMKEGDIVFVVDTDASPITITAHRVVSLSTSDRSVDLTNGDTFVTGTDSD